jgi:DNA repair protein RadD
MAPNDNRRSRVAFGNGGDYGSSNKRGKVTAFRRTRNQPPDHSLVLLFSNRPGDPKHGVTDEPVESTLTPDKRAQPSAHAARLAPRAIALVDCPECSAARWQGRPCPACGWRPRPKAKPVDTLGGKLGKLRRDGAVNEAIPTAAEKGMVYRQLLWIARERGYRAGWAAHKFRERFSAWPTRRDVEPVAPTPAVLSWARSRQIAYANATQKGRAP